MASKEKNAEAIARAQEFKNVPWCEDYERMISGMLYDAGVPELVEARLRARRLCKRYNEYLPDDGTAAAISADREVMLGEILGKIGSDAVIEPPFNVDYGCNISVGKRFYSNYNMIMLDCGLITIGDNVMFGPSVSIYAATHETEVQSRRDNIEYAGEVNIGNDCWIGGQVVILPGVTIGNGCTIGAGSVVTKSIPPYSVAVGAPARVIKKVTPLPES